MSDSAGDVCIATGLSGDCGTGAGAPHLASHLTCSFALTVEARSMVMMMPDLTNRSSQPLAVPMSSFEMTSTLNSAAKLASASGG